jgi:hypothetical protein
MNGQSRETGSMERTSDKTKTHKKKNTTKYVFDTTMRKQTNANNVNKTAYKQLEPKTNRT